MIQMTNYKFYNYNITYNIKQNNILGIYCINNNLLRPLLLEIAGINKSDNLYYNSKKIYDNETYFDERIFLDCNKNILTTLVIPKITNNLQLKYNLIINETNLQKHFENLNVRLYGNYNGQYTFNDEGITLCNHTIALSSYKYPILLNPLENINDQKNIAYLKNNYKSCLMGITNLKKYASIIEELLLISSKKVFVLQSTSNLILLRNVISPQMIINECELDDLIIYQNLNNDNLILMNNLTFNQKKELKKFNINITEISIFDIGEHIC